MSIITVSRQLGSQGARIAMLILDRTEAQFLDREIVERMMQKHGIATDRITRFDDTQIDVLDVTYVGPNKLKAKIKVKDQALVIDYDVEVTDYH